jgi:hypothetical protein
MNASGGAAAPLNDASEEFGTNAPRNEQFGDDENSTSTSNNTKTGASSSSSTSKAASSSQQSTSKSSSSGAGKSGRDNESHDKNDLEDISREKAKRYVNMNEEDVEHAGTPNSKDDVERSSQRAPKDAGPKEDIELLHGKTTLEGNDRSKQSGSSKGGNGSGNGSDGQNSNDKTGKQGGGGSDNGGAHNDDPMRHNAEKFVNLDD